MYYKKIKWVLAFYMLFAKAVKRGKLVLAKGKNDEQGYTIQTIDKTIYIAGKAPIGVLYGVYELIEQVDEPIVIEFKSFNMGRLNLLDGLQLDNSQ